MPITPDDRSALESSATEMGLALCARLVERLPISGASISVVTEGGGGHSVIGASDSVAAALEARQFELGVGPHWEALRTELPAFLYRSVIGLARILWQQLEVDVALGSSAAMFAFPLKLGAAVVGVADLYSRSVVEPWSAEIIDRARTLTSSTASTAVRLATESARSESSTAGTNAVELRREVHQATGMVMGQLGCTASTALVRLRAHAFTLGRSIDSVARDVVARRLDFTDA